MFGFGPVELIFLAVIVLVLFGRRLPAAMRALGGSITSFKKGMQDEDNDGQNQQNLDK
ncbi:Sec-independent protein translocase subunit TatA/TatB [Planctomicrobium sp. SH527]|uniref:Sec-independent protein translocase subunit TatA/TatB n=1 Tax=Planctomicrobium sp. SH527 TaxID=3448123 RepID=UPI003F5B2019